MSDEIWLPIAGFPYYEVSDLGRVRSSNPNGVRAKSAGGILKPWPHMFDYPMVQLYAGGKSRKLTVHGLVCAAFHGPKPTPRHQVAHFDGDVHNASAVNLRWALPTENAADKIRHGTNFNSGQFRRTLSAEDVREIRVLCAQGVPQSKIAARFGIWQTMVSHIKTGKRFRDVT